MKLLKWEGLWYKSVPELTEDDEEWDGGSGMCTGCAFENTDCSKVRRAMELDCGEDNEYDPEEINGVIYVPIEVQDIPLIAKQEKENE